VGRLLELDVGPVAHGGHCVARVDDEPAGRVVFVRHTLPGERVVARVTDGGSTSRFLRADAVEVLRASPDRVVVRCPVAGPGGCGGCDWQHVSVAGQHRLKAAVVAEQLHRLGHVDVPVEVEAVAGDHSGLGWRTRVQYAVDDEGRLGFRRHRSHDVVAVQACPIAHARVQAAPVTTLPWPGVRAVEVVTGTGSDDQVVVVHGSSEVAVRQAPAGAGLLVAEAPAGDRRERASAPRRVQGRGWVHQTVTAGTWQRTFRVSGAGFWQVHPGAADAFVAAVLHALQPRPGERVLDLYAGAGLFAAALADAVGPEGEVVAVESDAGAVRDARRNLHDLPQVRLLQGRVDVVLRGQGAPVGTDRAVDLVVLDPPRTGAKSLVVRQVAARRPRAVAYVACDPAALARDVALFAEHGYRLDGVRAFDAFPMTQHVECVARLVENISTSR
jgi:tRNA/tmRNA/rRNA uracil-C5-methylase (TrmA/RlmC/RlmD family)